MPYVDPVKRHKYEADRYAKNKVVNFIKLKNVHYKTKYGISLDEYDRLFELQGGVCRICAKPENSKAPLGGVRRLSVDHDHKTGKIRGLLCCNCNRGLGGFNDSIDSLQKAILYLIGQD